MNQTQINLDNTKNNDVTILLMVPERIIALDLQISLEKKGFNILNAESKDLVASFEDKEKINLVIIDLDRVSACEFLKMIQNFPLAEFSIIGISSENFTSKEFECVRFLEIFKKPFDSKAVACFIEKNIMLIRVNSLLKKFIPASPES